MHEQCFPKITFVSQGDGPTLGLAEGSGVIILQEDGRFFKDLNRDGKLDKYVDWRLSPEERARDLASKMTIEQLAGLMLHSNHQTLPAASWSRHTYGEKPYMESGAQPHDLTDQQIEYLVKRQIRNLLLAQVESPAAAAIWNNKLQALTKLRVSLHG